MKKLSTGRIWDYGIDYLTVTYPHNSAAKAEIEKQAHDHREFQEGEGYATKEGATPFFKGWRTEGLFHGENKTHGMVQWSGASAQRAGTRLAECRGTFNITRVDFQVTTRTQEEQTDIYKELWKALRGREKRDSVARAIPITVVDNIRHGSTIYLGSRKSPRFLRIYNKTREQRMKVEKWLTRYESQNTGEYASSLFESFHNGGRKQGIAIDVVTSHLLHLKINPPWKSDVAPLKMPSTYTVPDDEKWIEYMVETYRNRIPRLRHSGKLRDLLDGWNITCDDLQ